MSHDCRKFLPFKGAYVNIPSFKGVSSDILSLECVSADTPPAQKEYRPDTPTRPGENTVNVTNYKTRYLVGYFKGCDQLQPPAKNPVETL